MARASLSSPRTRTLIVSVLIGVLTLPAAAAVRIWEEQVTFPTYKIGEPDSNPMFFKGEVYQGASKVIYPYPFLDSITDEKIDKAWNLVYLENEYIKVSFAPELGGRLFSALDKTNNYDYFYRHIAIKPALIGMLGAWISGGIEWCVLHHHRNTTYMPVDYTLVENPDGSKTLYFGETELRHRIKWVLAATIFPGKSYIQVTGKISNRTPYPHSFLNWANVAVHVNDDYQVIFPPSVSYAVYHAKNDFAHWPIANETYQNVDYQGVDLSWWKNHPEPVSFFAWDMQEDFSGGYDHGKKAGVIHIGNHHILPSAKLWEFSPGPTGRMWDRILSVNNEPYAEIMVGAYSDNQPDYSWIQPYETKTWTQYWYPVREIGGFKNANLDAAVNLELKDNVAKLGFNTTGEFQNARAVLKAKDKLLLERTLTISPDKPFVADVNVPPGTKQTDLEAALYSADNKLLISYRPAEKQYDPNLPDTVKPPPAPKDVSTVEELYLIGLRLQQFYNPTIDAYPYFQEALRRDPGDSRTNTILGLDYNKRGMFPEAEKHLRTAVERIAKNYTRPRDCEAYYQLGIALRALGKLDEACDSFYRAAWDHAFTSAAYYQLAEISCGKGDFKSALDEIDHCIATNALNNKARNVKVMILRKMGKPGEARVLAADVLACDPIDFLAANEMYLAATAEGNSNEAARLLSELKGNMRDNKESYLELAADYFNCGLVDSAIDILQRAAGSDNKALNTYPMVYYSLGYLYQQKGDKDNARKNYDLAAKMPPDFCFPFRNEDTAILTAAVAQNPTDARGFYYLGNALYDKQPEKAIIVWEKSRDLEPAFAAVHRNLGWGYYRAQNNIPKAILSYEKSIQCARDARVLAELDQLYEIGGTPPQKRVDMLEGNLAVATQRDDSYIRYIMALAQVGRYDDVIKCLDSRHFHAREGSAELREVYVDAHLLRAKQRMDAGKYAAALADSQAAAEYPANLEVGRGKSDRRATQVNYCIAAAYEALGDSARATEYYTKAAGEQTMREPPRTQWWKGLALTKTGQADKAKEIFDRIIETGRKRLAEDTEMDFFAKFGERETKEARQSEAHFIIALGLVGNKQYDNAKVELQKAIELNPNHLWAKAQLAALK